MKFCINSTLLAETVAAASSSLASNPTIPILGGLLVEAQLGAVTMSSFNYDRATTRTAAADVYEPDTAVVSGRLLGVASSNLPKNADTAIECVGSEMLVRAARAEFRLPLMVTEDYPALPQPGDPIGTVDCETFVDAVKTVAGYASKELPESIKQLSIRTTPTALILSATDRFVIVRRHVTWTGNGEHIINVPAADILATVKSLTGSEVQLLWDNKMFGMRTSSTTVINRVSAEEFPAIDKIVAEAGPFLSAATVPTAELGLALRRASSVADDQHGRINLHVGPEGLSVTTSHSVAGKVHDAIDAAHHGADWKFTLSSRRLLGVLAAVDDDQMTAAFKDNRLIYLYPGAIDADLIAPDTDTVAVLFGMRE